MINSHNWSSTILCSKYRNYSSFILFCQMCTYKSNTTNDNTWNRKCQLFRITGGHNRILVVLLFSFRYIGNLFVFVLFLICFAMELSDFSDSSVLNVALILLLFLYVIDIKKNRFHSTR